MLTRSTPTLRQTNFNPVEEGVLVKLNKRLKLTEVTDKKAEVLGAISRIGYSAEKMATFSNKLDAFINAEEGKKKGSLIKTLRRRSWLGKEPEPPKEPIFTKEIATELREQITQTFPITAFSIRPPTEGDLLDFILESYVTGACKNRFYQVDAADKFLESIKTIQKEVLRSLVTGLRGMGNFRNVKTQEVYPSDDPFKDLTISNVIATFKGMQGASAQASVTEVNLADLAKFEQVGIRAYELLSEDRLCYGEIKTNFKDWGAASADETCPVQKIIQMLEADLLVPEKKEQVTAFIGKLNQVIVEAIELSVEFEALRHAEEGVEIEPADKALTKELYRAPSAFYKESNIAAAEAYYENYKEKDIKDGAGEQSPQEEQSDSDAALGATGGVSEKGEKKAGKSKLLTGLTGSFFKRKQQEGVQFKPKVEIPAKTGDLAFRLPLGFAYQDGKYVFQGNAQSVEYLDELAELAVHEAEPVKTCMEWEFISYSDGMYRMKTNPYYMLIEGHIYSSDLAYELVKEESGAEQSMYETIKIPDGREIPLTKDIKVTTPIKKVPANSEPAAKLIFQTKEDGSGSSKSKRK